MTERTSLKTNVTTNLAGKARWYNSLFRREEGQSAFEFLLVLPLFVLAFLLVVDLGMLMYQYVSVSNAVREGARFGAVNCGDGSCEDDGSETVKQRTIARSSGILNPNSNSVTVGFLDNTVPADNNRGRGDSVVVKVDHDYTFMFLPGSFSMPVVSCADMSLEQSDTATTLPTATGC